MKTPLTTDQSKDLITFVYVFKDNNQQCSNISLTRRKCPTCWMLQDGNLHKTSNGQTERKDQYFQPPPSSAYLTTLKSWSCISVNICSPVTLLTTHTLNNTALFLLPILFIQVQKIQEWSPCRKGFGGQERKWLNADNFSKKNKTKKKEVSYIVLLDFIVGENLSGSGSQDIALKKWL